MLVYLLTLAWIATSQLCVSGARLDPESPILTIRLLENPSLEIGTIRDLGALIKRAKLDLKSKELKALRDLEPLLELASSSDVCNSNTGPLVFNYAQTHLAKGSDTRSQPVLQRVFVGLAYELSEACQTSLAQSISNGLGHKHELGSGELADLLDSFDGSLTSLDNYARLEYVHHKLLAGDHLRRGRSALLEVSDLDKARRLRKLCNQGQLWPLVERLVSPLVELNQAGFDYQGPRNQEQRGKLARSPLARRLYAIASACDLLRNSPNVCRARSAIEAGSYRLTFNKDNIIKTSSMDCLEEERADEPNKTWEPLFEVAPVQLEDELWLAGSQLDSLVTRHGQTKRLHWKEQLKSKLSY